MHVEKQTNWLVPMATEIPETKAEASLCQTVSVGQLLESHCGLLTTITALRRKLPLGVRGDHMYMYFTLAHSGPWRKSFQRGFVAL